MIAQKHNFLGLLFLLLLLISAMTGAPAVLVSETRAEPGSTVKLIMIEELGCPYCELWNEEVGVIYPKTPEGKFAPLSRYYKGDRRAGHIGEIAYTPTFVIMQGDREVGRIVGYPGEEFFWAWLKEILAKAGFKPVS